MDKIKEIKSNKEEYKKIKDNFANYKFKTVEQMQEEYFEIYKNTGQIKNERACTTELDNLQIKTDVYDLRILRQNLTDEMNNLTNKMVEVNDKLHTSKEELQNYKARYGTAIKKIQKTQNSKAYKTLKKIKDILKGEKNG